jgi:transcriptional regulator with XRE-family HTH domain
MPASRGYTAMIALAHYMKRTKQTQAELSRATGLPQACISKWLNGKGFPSTQSLRRLSKVTGIPIGRLFDEI